VHSYFESIGGNIKKIREVRSYNEHEINTEIKDNLKIEESNSKGIS